MRRACLLATIKALATLRAVFRPNLPALADLLAAPSLRCCASVGPRAAAVIVFAGTPALLQICHATMPVTPISLPSCRAPIGPPTGLQRARGGCVNAGHLPVLPGVQPRWHMCR